MLHGSNSASNKRRKANTDGASASTESSSGLGGLIEAAALIEKKYELNGSVPPAKAAKLIKLLPPGSRVTVTKSAPIETIKAITHAPRIVLRLNPDISKEQAEAAAESLPPQSTLHIGRNLPLAIAKTAIKNMGAMRVVGLPPDMPIANACELVKHMPQTVFLMPSSKIGEEGARLLIPNLAISCPVWLHEKLSAAQASAIVTSLKPGGILFFSIQHETELEVAKHAIALMPKKCGLMLDPSTPFSFASQAIASLPAGSKLLLSKESSEDLVAAAGNLTIGCELVAASGLSEELLVQAISSLKPSTKYRLDANLPPAVLDKVIEHLGPGRNLVIDANCMSSPEKRATTYAAIAKLGVTSYLEIAGSCPVEYIPAIFAKLKVGSTVFIHSFISVEQAITCAKAMPEWASMAFSKDVKLSLVKKTVSALFENQAVILKSDSSEAMAIAIAENLPEGNILFLGADLPLPVAMAAATRLNEDSILGMNPKANTALNLKLAASLAKGVTLLVNNDFSAESIINIAKYLSPSARLMLTNRISAEKALQVMKHLPAGTHIAIAENCPKALFDIIQNNLPARGVLHISLETQDKLLAQAPASAAPLLGNCLLQISPDTPDELAIEGVSRLAPSMSLAFAPDFPHDRERITAICKQAKKVRIYTDTPSDLAVLIKSCLPEGCLLEEKPEQATPFMAASAASGGAGGHSSASMELVE